MGIAADTLTLDPRTRRLCLEGSVQLQAERYRVLADRLTLPWPVADELQLQGPGRLTLCPCDPPPIALRFDRLSLARNGSLVLVGPVLELGGVPVLWAPWLRLEPPDRFGLLPFELAWRGRDGLLLGGGVHVPLGRDLQRYVQLSASAYTAGGLGLAIAAASSQSSSRVRWESLAGSGLWLDLRGRFGDAADFGATWTVDAVRGTRGIEGTLELDSAARSSDRARLSVGGSAGALSYGVTLRADTTRGGSLTRIDSAGPELMLGFGAALGHSATIDANVALQQVTTPTDSLTLTTQRASLAIAHPIDVFALAGDVALSSDARLGNGGWLGAELAARLRLGLPLLRRGAGAWLFGPGAAHWLEPFVEATASSARTSGRPELGYFSLAGEGESASVSTGLATRFGTPDRREALALQLRAGSMRWNGQWYSGLSWRAGASASLARGASSGAAAANGRRWLSTTRLELGPERGFTIAGYLEGETGELALRSLLDRAETRRAWAPWFSTPGWTTSFEFGVPAGQHLRLSLTADADITSERWLARGARLAYDGPCRCLSLVVAVQQRLGRDGIDASLGVELTPR
jgi:hypothetical protein